jgi:hypothetical protein
LLSQQLCCLFVYVYSNESACASESMGAEAECGGGGGGEDDDAAIIKPRP